MKFHRTDLIVRVEAAIAAKKKAADERNAKAAADYEAKLARWIAETSDAWKQLADTIRVRLRAGKPMTAGDIPRRLRDGWSGSHITTWNISRDAPYVADVAALEQLLVLLSVATDDEVTTSALERMGFRTAALFTH